ncbi:hypothetical protein EV182_003783, partial [Spiromyces aspiralis]
MLDKTSELAQQSGFMSPQKYTVFDDDIVAGESEAVHAGKDKTSVESFESGREADASLSNQKLSYLQFSLVVLASWFLVFLTVFEQIVLAPAFVTLNAYAGSNVSSIWYIASYMLGYLPFLLIGARAYLDVSRIGAFVTG